MPLWLKIGRTEEKGGIVSDRPGYVRVLDFSSGLYNWEWQFSVDVRPTLDTSVIAAFSIRFLSSFPLSAQVQIPGGGQRRWRYPWRKWRHLLF